jgi:hypothetical protein
MTHPSTYLAAALLFALPLAACSESDAAKAKESAKHAAEVTGDKLTELKDKFVASTQKEMDELSVKYDELKAKAANATDEAKAGLQSTLDDIKAKRDELKADFEDAKRAHNGSAFEATKAKLQEGLADLRRKIDDALHKNG